MAFCPEQTCHIYELASQELYASSQSLEKQQGKRIGKTNQYSHASIPMGTSIHEIRIFFAYTDYGYDHLETSEQNREESKRRKNLTRETSILHRHFT